MSRRRSVPCRCPDLGYSRAVPQRAQNVEQVVRDWLAAKQAGDADAIRANLSAYEGAQAIGTDPAEWWSGTDAFTEAHASGGPFTAMLDSVEAHREGSVAWAAVRGVIETGEPGGLPVRLTLVLTQDGESHWRVVQSHASTPSDA
jgi:ketosteroid isomerase-like protein